MSSLKVQKIGDTYTVTSPEVPFRSLSTTKYQALDAFASELIECLENNPSLDWFGLPE